MKEKTSQEIKVKAQNDKKKKKKKSLALIVHDLGDHSNFLDLQK